MTTTLCETEFDQALNIARQALYRFAALSLLDPKAGSWNQLRRLCDEPLLVEAAALVRSLPEAVPPQQSLGERPLSQLDPAAVLSHLPDSGDQHNEQYESTFGLLVSNACPPYETEYISSKFPFQRSHALADISGFYRAFGLGVSTTHPERPDHIVQELEFMAVLLGLERQADTLPDPEVRRQRLHICRQAQARFLREHLAWWSTALARLLARENPGGFFAAAGTFLAALIPAERALLAVEPPTKVAEPTSLEPPEACDGCALS